MSSGLRERIDAIIREGYGGDYDGNVWLIEPNGYNGMKTDAVTKILAAVRKALLSDEAVEAAITAALDTAFGEGNDDDA